MSPEQQASLLADWLQGQPGAEPPPGLDPDVVEGVYALRPDRAPAPRVSVEDILAGLDAGPVSAKGAAAPPFPEGEVVSLAPQRARPMRLWAMIGTIAAAAAVLFVVVPSEDQAPSVGPAPEAPATTSLFEPTLEAGAEAGPNEVPTPPPADPAPLPRQQLASNAQAPAKVAPTTPPPMAVGGAAASSYERMELPRANAPGAGPSTLTEVDAAEDNERAKDEDFSAPVAKSSAGYAPDEPVEEQSVETVSQASKRDRSDRSATRATSSSNVATPEPAASAGSGKAVGNLDAFRSTASPADYNASWYTGADAATSARVTALLEQARAADRRGAVSIYAGAITDNDLRVGQDFAGRAARQSLDLGDPSSALRYTQQGIARSSTNTAFLARLYALQGEAYERLNNPEAASAAYARATALNMER